MRLTIRACGENRGRESWTSASGANTFASYTPHSSSSGYCAKSGRGLGPSRLALLTRRSIGSPAVSTSRRRWSESATSPAIAITPARPATACSSASAPRASTASCQPRSERARVSASPRPRVAPVTIPRTRARLQVQVSLKSNGQRAFSLRAVPPAPHRRGRTPQRRGLLGPSLLRAARPDQLRAGGLGTPPLPAAGASKDRLHRLRPAHRADTRGDRRRARQASSPPRAHPPRLVTPLSHVDFEDRRTHRRARAPPARAHRVHRLRLPLARPLPARQPRRPRRPSRLRPALLDRRPAPEPTHVRRVDGDAILNACRSAIASRRQPLTR